MELTIPPQAQPAAATAEQDKSFNAASDQFSFEEFFDFSNEEEDDDVQLASDNLNADAFHSIKAESESLLGDSSCNSSLADFGSSILTSDLCVPYDDLAELEWVSTFAEESFSSEDMEKLQFISGLSSARTEQTRPDPNTTTNYRSEILVPGKARSKRPRTAPENWTSRLLLVSEPDTDPKPIKKPKIIRKCGAQYLPVDGRKCLHCQTDRTPQWRTGPLGPKTLCNACGVRYKSGRLVPEYRPASSPTFIQTEHSNSHRKVLELRKKKETSGSIMGVGSHYQLHDQYLKQIRNLSYVGSDCEDYLIHRPDFGELI